MHIILYIEFELRGPGPSGRTCTPTTVYLYYKIKISRKKSSSGLLFTANILHEAMYLAFSTWAKSHSKSNSKMQDFKGVLDLILLVKGELNSLTFSIGFQMFKIYKFFKMALNTCEF